MLTVTALIIALVIAIPLGIISAYKPYSAWDYGSSVFAFIGAATPNFFAAMILIYVFSIKAGWLPTSGMYDVQECTKFSDIGTPYYSSGYNSDASICRCLYEIYEKQYAGSVK